MALYEVQRKGDAPDGAMCSALIIAPGAAVARKRAADADMLHDSTERDFVATRVDVTGPLTVLSTYYMGD